MLRDWKRSLVAVVASTALLCDSSWGAVAITTPANGISVPALPANPVNGTGSPNNTCVNGSIGFKASGAGYFVVLDNLNMCLVKSGNWSTSAVFNGVYTASGTYEYAVTRFNPANPGAGFDNAKNTCTIP